MSAIFHHSAAQPSQKLLKIETLKDLNNFGNPLAAADINFRWPTKEDLTRLNINEPLILKEVRTKGVQGDDLTAIQLVFQNGIESPLFDGKHPRATELSTV